ncbi:hypothetical protein SAMN05421830_103122 [Desulfomicrobium norvegicum]|uniref:Divergent polysaccharide deacetylase n=1 Tax=Desulfomicrobium norvegicum (strain DSM 1741 / NCIMB 8310) TaxID=52561 RepID=A0A8G2C1M0_DESNO|nr:divergent polysaccharide deacetylase family protein [Desulfomicrobium norvegicum]SFL52628.1 hypothetical protein SAMN05421830_103122 [Desulfomicrobium norvegicum]
MPPKKRKKKKPAAKASGFSLFKSLLWICVVLLTGLTLFVAMHLPLRNAPSKPGNVQPPVVHKTSEEPAAQSRKDSRSRQASTRDASVQKNQPLAYEAQIDDFDAKVRSVDLAILMGLAAQGESESLMRHRTVEVRRHGGQEFYYQNLTINLGHEVFPFLAELKKNLDQLGPDFSLKTVDSNPRDLEISILGEPTHHIFLPLSLVPEPEPEVPTVRAPRLVIIIDDLGESMSVAKRLADLPFAVSFSVLPHNTKARQVADLARQEDLELLLHLPCEPEGYPKSANSGPGTLRVNMNPAVLEQTLADNLARLPEVDGVNNHMGSRLTQDKKAMTVVLAHLQGRGKFFVDSLTTPKSCVRDVSKTLGLRYYRRHIFLDNTAKEHAILLQLKKAESLAKRTGLAVAIGHPYPATLSALESWARTRDMSVVICKIQDI